MEGGKSNQGRYKKSNKNKYREYLSQVDSSLRDEWKKEQNSLKEKLIEKNDEGFSVDEITKIGGLDISFSKYDKSLAVVALVVLDFNNLNKILYENYEFVTLTQPYVPGFLAFREVEHLKKLVDELTKNKPELVPEIFLIDGNGIIHNNRFGLACHLGVLCNIRTIGCGKTVFAVDGITVNRVADLAEKNLKKKGDFFYLQGLTKSIWGAAVKSSSRDPIIVSVGHRIELDTAIQIVNKATKFKVTEPVRIADINSRKIINKYDKENYVAKYDQYDDYEGGSTYSEYDDEYYFLQI